MSTLSIFNPANGQLVNTLPADDAASVATKAAAARSAQAAWAATPLATRKSCVEKFRASVVQDMDALALTMTRETGKPVQLSRNELNGLLGRIDFFLAQVDSCLATETVMAAKDMDYGGLTLDLKSSFVGEVADLWFHSMIALAHYGLSPLDVIAELERREGTSGIEEKALRKAESRDLQEHQAAKDERNTA